MMENKKGYLFGLLFTIILFLILDQFAPDVSQFVRVIAILILLLIGRFLFSKLFINDEESQ